MKLGETCFNAPNELYVQTLEDVEYEFEPLKCNEGIVTCGDCYRLNRENGLCELKEEATADFGEVCENSCQCYGDDSTICGPNKVCSCTNTNYLYDWKLKICRPREIWTPCTSNAECNNSTFTVDGGLCSGGFCSCRQRYMATFTGVYNETHINSLQICVLDSAKSHLQRREGAPCIVDPIYHGGQLSALSTGVCRSSLACITCEGEADQEVGICRRFHPNRTILATAMETRIKCASDLLQAVGFVNKLDISAINMADKINFYPCFVLHLMLLLLFIYCNFR